MMQRTKTFLLIGGFILSVFAIAFFLYFSFLKPTAPEATIEEHEETLSRSLPAGIEALIREEEADALGENNKKMYVNWSPNDQVVAFAKTATAIQGGIDRNVIYPVEQNKENFKGLVVEGLNFDSLWSPGEKQLLYSVMGDYSQNKPLLEIFENTLNEPKL